eukprot:1429272-Amphidinium_carterae.1
MATSLEGGICGFTCEDGTMMARTSCRPKKAMRHTRLEMRELSAKQTLILLTAGDGVQGANLDKSKVSLSDEIAGNEYIT